MSPNTSRLVSSEEEDSCGHPSPFPCPTLVCITRRQDGYLFYLPFDVTQKWNKKRQKDALTVSCWGTCSWILLNKADWLFLKSKTRGWSFWTPQLLLHFDFFNFIFFYVVLHSKFLLISSLEKYSIVLWGDYNLVFKGRVSHSTLTQNALSCLFSLPLHIFIYVRIYLFVPVLTIISSLKYLPCLQDFSCLNKVKLN